MRGLESAVLVCVVLSASLGPGGPSARASRAAELRARQDAAGEAFAWRASGDAFVADAGRGAFRLDGGALSVSAPGGEWSGRLRTASWSRAGRALPLSPPSVSVRGNEATLGRGALQETWVHGPEGAELVYVVERRPTGTSPLRVELAVEGLSARVAGDDAELSADDHVVATVHTLYVSDARGREVPSWLEAEDGSLRIVVDDAAADYPLTIDPIVAVERAQLAPTGFGSGGDQFGVRVAISRDGLTALVGANGDAGAGGVATGGAAYVFTYAAGAWRYQSRLTPPALEGDQWGVSVALSADGNTAAVGSHSVDVGSRVDAGGVAIFVRTGGVWAQQALLVPSGAGSDGLGQDLALTDDGNMLLAAAPTGNYAAVYTRSAATWSLQTTLSAPTASSVALSADGLRAAVGAPGGFTVCCAPVGVTRVFLRSGSTWTLETTLTLAGAADGDAFGTDVALSSDAATLLVGARGDDTSVADTGSAHVYTRSGTTWSLQATLPATGLAASDAFGQSVALSSDGSSALVGAPYVNHTSLTDPGAVRAFVRSGTTWTQEAVVLAASAGRLDYFGYSVALAGDASHGLVGAFNDDGAVRVVGAGSVRALEHVGAAWTESDVLVSETESSGASYGLASAIAADGSFAILGGYLDDSAAGIDAGGARVFARSGSAWTETTRLTPSGAAAGDRFGGSVAISADGLTAVIGAHADDTAAGANAGSARVFVRSGSAWTESATLLASDGAAGDRFGISVDVSADGTTVIVGADLDNSGLGGSGSAHVYVRSGSGTWSEQAILTASTPVSGANFGWAVALSDDGNTAAVGAPFDDTPTNNAGSVRVYRRTGSTWAETTRLTAADAAADDRLGYSVAISSDATRIATGVLQDDPRGVDSGAIRTFVVGGGGWVAEASLDAAAGAAGDELGRSIALSADGATLVVGATGDDVPAVDGGSATVFVREAGTWREASTLVAVGTVDEDGFGRSVGINANGSLALVGGYLDDTAVGFDGGSARVFELQRQLGDACTGASQCGSGECVDGVCCNTPCGGGVNDCQACSVAAGASANGTCALLSASTTCRASRGGCDPAEQCDGSTGACPADSIRSSGEECRASAGACDVAEVCDGSSPSCPADARMPVDTPCGPSLGGCDPAEACDGTSAVCPANVVAPAGTPCRLPVGECDVTEVCDGAGPVCPIDLVLPAATSCRAAINSCDVSEACDGVSGLCPADAVAPATTLCGEAPAGVCDAPDHCDGEVAACEATFLSGVECREAVGGCDRAEVCAGSSADCPPDGVEAAGMTCRASINPVCDPAEVCDGTTATCPTDVVDPGCSAPDGGPADAGASPDAGEPPPPPVGACSCRVGHAASGWLAVVGALALGLVARRRGRRRVAPARTA